MSDPSFFDRPTPLSLAEIVALTGARPPEGADLDRPISGVASLDRARAGDISFLDSVRYIGALAATGAGACFCTERNVALVPARTVGLATPEPYRAFAQVGAKLFPAAVRLLPITGEPGIAPSAHVHPDAVLEPEVTVESGAVIGPRAEIGRGSLIGPGSVIGPSVHIGRDVRIGANATVTNALLGNRVILHPGVRLGQDGFGYVPGSAGHTKIMQVGRLIVQDDVEIGANTTIDRGSHRDTIIGEGTKIDNLVQIGHNVVVGRHCLIAAHVGISGSVTIGDFVMFGGQVGVRDHVTIGHGARIAAMAGVHTDVPAGETWCGIPAQPMQEWLRGQRSMRRLAARGSAAGEGSTAGKGDVDG